MAFSGDTFQAELHVERFGRACRVVVEIASTIDLAWEWLRAGGPDGGVVIAERQTRGRGRLDREWASPDGGLWMSVITRPEVPAGRAGRLGVMMALAGAEAVSRETGCAAQIAWPNDVVIDGRKVGGVLVETEIESGLVRAAVLSLGLDVNMALEDLPQPVRETATTLLAVTGKRHSLEAMAARVLENLEREWPKLLADTSGLTERWQARDALLGTEVTVEAGETTIHGWPQGIEEDGALRLLTSTGIRRLTVGEVRRVRRSTA